MSSKPLIHSCVCAVMLTCLDTHLALTALGSRIPWMFSAQVLFQKNFALLSRRARNLSDSSKSGPDKAVPRLLGAPRTSTVCGEMR